MCVGNAWKRWGPVFALAFGSRKFQDPPLKGVLREWKKNYILNRFVIYTTQ